MNTILMFTRWPGWPLRLAPVFGALAVAIGCADDPGDDVTIEALGEALFFDQNLSWNRTQSCATCHDPDHAFADPRLDPSGHVGAVSLGDDGVSLGDRNAPTAAYGAFVTPLGLTRGTRQRFNRHDRDRVYEGALGGLFLDGRAVGLEGQAAGPPLNPIEMGLPDVATAVDRVLETEAHARGLRALFGAELLEDDDATYVAVTQAIAAFERTEAFAPFDSTYDRFLRGEASLSFLELTGRSLFFSEFTNCGVCHQLHRDGDPVDRFRETFSGYEYHNLGVPPNEAVRAVTGVEGPDLGLGGLAGFDDPAERGKFKVPTLRNVAVTGPYMHNGVFRELRTTVLFYEQHHDPVGRAINPETGAPWAAPEVPETVATDLLQIGRTLTDGEVDALVCFLRALTDRRWEPLIPDDGLDCAD